MIRIRFTVLLITCAWLVLIGKIMVDRVYFNSKTIEIGFLTRNNFGRLFRIINK